MKKVTINGKELALKSRGQEEVYIYGDKFRRTVYATEDYRFFVNIHDEFLEVYHKAQNFSTSK